MEETKEKQEINNVANTKSKSDKIIFIILLLIFIILAAIVIHLAYGILEQNKNNIVVSGVTLQSKDSEELLLVEMENNNIANTTKQQNTTTQNNEQTAVTTPNESVQTNNQGNNDITANQTEQKSENVQPQVTENSLSNQTNNNNSEVVVTKTTSIAKTPETSLNPYYIKVNYTANVVTIYSQDSNGNYTVPVKAMLCSSGKATPLSGVYATPAKYRWALLMGDVWGQYSTRIVGGILFHSVPYSAQSKSALKSNYYDKLGLSVSAGCIRLTVGDAKWIYDNCPIGTKVEFYSSSDPGPLGKPATMKISGYPNYLKCWDPTDPDPNNPWITYFSNNQN